MRFRYAFEFFFFFFFFFCFFFFFFPPPPPIIAFLPSTGTAFSLLSSPSRYGAQIRP